MTERHLAIRVECYSGYRGQETPQRFYLGQRKVEVAEVIDRWLGPAHRYFKVRTADDDVYIIRHDAEVDAWELILFEAARRDRRGG